MSAGRFPSILMLLLASSSLLGADPGRGSPGTGDPIDLRNRVSREEYGFSALRDQEGVWSAPNRGQGLRTRVSQEGIEVFPRTTDASGVGAEWRLGLRTESLGRPGSELPLTRGRLSAKGRRVELDRGPVVEWIENDASGIEQGWTIERRPAGEGELRIVVDLEGGFEARIEHGGRSATFERAAFTLPYRSLRAWDSGGNDLSARIVGCGTRIRIEVDDEGAIYPLTIDPTLSWMGESNQADAGFGTWVSSAGDVNGDGYGDVIVGAPYFDNGQADEGRAFVYLGSATGLSASPDWTAESDQIGAQMGTSVATAGDVNNDGYSDVLIGARFFDNGETNEGAAFLFLGSQTFASDPQGTPSNADWIAESNQTNGQAGLSVSTAGDVNGDDYDDVLIDVRKYDDGETDEGAVFLFLGSQTIASDPNGTPLNAAWTAEGDQVIAEFGSSVAAAGDVDHDGYSDVIVGAVGFGSGQPGEGRAYVYLGSATGLATNPAWTLEGNQDHARFSTVSTAGDVNGDGYDDVIVGADGFDNGQTDEGRAYVYFGSASGPSTNSDWTAEGDQAGGNFGVAVSTAGDVNGDGYSDVIVGAHLFAFGEAQEGRSFLYLGSALGLSTTPTWTGEGNQVNAFFGLSVATAGDVNGDGYDDFMVGAYGFDNGQTDEGAAFLYLGEPPPVLYDRKISATSGGFTGTLDGGDSFASPEGIGDLNGDGIQDLAVGAFFDDDGGANRGAVWILFLNQDGTVQSQQKISDTAGGFT